MPSGPPPEPSRAIRPSARNHPVTWLMTHETVEAWYRRLLSLTASQMGSVSLSGGAFCAAAGSFVVLPPPRPSSSPSSRERQPHPVSMQGVRAGIVWRSAAIVVHGQPRHHGDRWTGGYARLLACTAKTSVGLESTVPVPGDTSITRSIDNGCISGRQRNFGAILLSICLPSKRRLLQPSHVPLGLPPWGSSREVRTLDARLALPAPTSKYRSIFRSFPLGPVVSGTSRLAFAGPHFATSLCLGLQTQAAFFPYLSRIRRASPGPRPAVHPPASDKNNGQMRRVGDGKKGGRPPRERRQVGNSARRERYRIVPGPMRTMAVPTRYWSSSL